MSAIDTGVRGALGIGAVLLGLLAAVLLLVGLLLGPARPASAESALGGRASASATVYAFPIPGAKVALPQTQIAFRGAVPAPGSVQVSGSATGVHTGTIETDSDRLGASLVPATAFAPGETVTVKTAMNIAGGRGGAYQFTVANVAPPDIYATRVIAHNVKGAVERYRSRPDLAPAAVTISKNSRHTAQGDLFLAPQSSPVQDGPQIRDWRGRLIWYARMPRNQYASDFREQTYDGQPVLTWWQGYVTGGVGYGIDLILNDHYQPIGGVHGAGNLLPDLHEFLITSRNTALITAYYPVYWSERSIHGPARAVVLDAIVQEIDIRTGALLFDWDSLDHVGVSDSYQKPWKSTSRPWDYFHVNSIQDLSNGDLLISARNTWAAYEISRQTGAIIWTLGGKHSGFRMGSGTGFAFQHDVELHGNNLISMLDDGAGPPVIHKDSRVLGLRMNFRHQRASLAFSWHHSPEILAYFEGNAQQLSDDHYFTGWGLKPYFSEFNGAGRMIFDGHFVCSCFSNRAYRFRWNATPAGPPDLAVAGRSGGITVYASWNGATGIGYWRLLEGASASRLRAVRRVRATGFETAIATRSARYVAVQALDSSGRQLSSESKVVKG